MKSDFTREDFKNLINKNIFIYPAGNAVPRNFDKKEDLIQEVTLTKLGRTTFTFKGNTYKINGELNRNNYGFYAFPTYQDCLNEIIKDEVCYNLRYKYNLSLLTIDEIFIIKNIFESK